MVCEMWVVAMSNHEPVAAEERRHSHPTGGAWNVTRWAVPGCLACAPEPVAAREPVEPGWYAYSGGAQSLVFHLRQDGQWSAHASNGSATDCTWGYVEQALGVWALVRLVPESSPILNPPNTLTTLVDQWGVLSIYSAFVSRWPDVLEIDTPAPESVAAAPEEERDDMGLVSVIHDSLCPIRESHGKCQFGDEGRTMYRASKELLASDWLRDHDARVRAEALREAAEEFALASKWFTPNEKWRFANLRALLLEEES